jgi:phenylacetate-CoA ligase
MNKHFLKNIRDNIPEPAKYILAPLFRNKLLNNEKFQQYYKLLNDSQNLSSDKIKEYQLEQLKSVLSYAYNNVPYYTNLFNKIGFDYSKISSLSDINVIPFLTKEIIRENFDKLTSKEKVAGGYYVATTGGSTGEPLKVLLDYDSIFKENAFVYFFRKRLGYEFNDKLATFRGVEFGDNLWKFNPMHNELVFSPFKLSKQTLGAYVKKIEKFNPQYLNGYLSCLYLFAKLLEENGIKLKLNLKGIFLISENIDDEQRSFLENFFGVKSSTFYGHSERCVIAEEPVKGLYKPSPFYGCTELIEGTTGYEIVSTGFLNHTMPLIRYKTGDICKKEGDLIAIQGRWNVDDYLLGVHDEKIFHSAFNFHSEIFKNVTNYQFLQEQKGEAELLLIVNKDFKSGELSNMRREIDKKTKDIINFNIRVVDTLLLSPRGKFKRFISKVKPVEATSLVD